MCVPNIHYKDAFKVLALNGLNLSVAKGSTKTVFHMISLQIPMEKS